MASFIRMPFMHVFHQSKCINAIKRILFYYRYVCILVFFHVFVCSLLLRCVLKSRALLVGEKTLHNTLPFIIVKMFLALKNFSVIKTHEQMLVISRNLL